MHHLQNHLEVNRCGDNTNYTAPGGRIINICDTRENKLEMKMFQVKIEDVGTEHEKSITSYYILCAN